MAVIKGVNVEKMEAFRDFVAKNPGKATLGLQARVVWEGHSHRSTAHIGPYRLGGDKIDRDTRHYTVPFGAWREVEDAAGIEGATDRMEPVETALAALGACLNTAIGLNAPRLGLKIDSLETTVSADVDPSVLFMLKDVDQHTACVPTVRYEVKVKGDLSDKDLKTLEKILQHSPVHGLVSQAQNVVTSVRRA